MKLRSGYERGYETIDNLENLLVKRRWVCLCTISDVDEEFNDNAETMHVTVLLEYLDLVRRNVHYVLRATHILRINRSERIMESITSLAYQQVPMVG